MAARAACHQERSADALHLILRDVDGRMAWQALDGALHFCRLHGDRGSKSAFVMTVYAVLPNDLAHPQRAERGDIALAGQIRRQVRDTLLNLAHLSDQSDREDQIDEHRQDHEKAKTEASVFWSLRRHLRILLRLLAMRRPVQ